MSIAVPQGWQVREITPNGVQDKYRVLASSDMDQEGLDVLHRDRSIQLETIDKKVAPSELKKLLSSTQEAVHGLIFRTTINDALRDHPDIIRQATDSLRVLIRAGIGVSENYPEAAAERGTIVMRTPEANRRSVYEWTMECMRILLNPLMINQSRRFKMNEEWSRDGWSLDELKDPFKGKTLFVIGAGGIGSRVAKDARSKGMKVLFIDPKVPFLEGCESVDMDRGLETADVITVHVDGEKMVLSPEHLRKIKKASIINTARGRVIHPGALKKALDEGNVRAAFIDVHWQEEQEHFKDEDSSALSQHPMVFPTAHQLGQEKSATLDNTVDAAQKMIAALNGGKVRDGWNTKDIELEGLFSNGSSYVLELMNKDVPGVHDEVYGEINELVSRRVNRGEQETSLSPFPVFEDEAGKKTIKLAHHLVQLDLNGVSQPVLQQVLKTIREVDGVLKAHLFHYSHQE